MIKEIENGQVTKSTKTKTKDEKEGVKKIILPKEAIDKLNSIKEKIMKAKNIYYFFDNDPDGLSSFLQLQNIKKGNFSVVKGTPRENQNYNILAQRKNADLVVVLDKPLMNNTFYSINIPVVWIDHHEPIQLGDLFTYFNPLNYNIDPYPTSYWSYLITKRNLWLASIGIVGDWQVVPELKKLKEEYPWLLNTEIEPEKLLFDSTLHKLIQIFSFSLIGQSSDVKRNIRELSQATSPEDILNNERIIKRVKKYISKYNKLLERAKKKAKEDKHKIFLFQYESTNSFTGDLSNELLHTFPEKEMIIVCRKRLINYSCSLRSKIIEIDRILKEALKEVNGKGGGHKYACGATVAIPDFEHFLDNLTRELEKR